MKTQHHKGGGKSVSYRKSDGRTVTKNYDKSGNRTSVDYTSRSGTRRYESNGTIFGPTEGKRRS